MMKLRRMKFRRTKNAIFGHPDMHRSEHHSNKVDLKNVTKVKNVSPNSASGSLLHCLKQSIFVCYPSGLELSAIGG